ncbi:Transcriptional repressor of sporulation [Cavenderia fasciculata]|uniref:Transcriptional repressor of sporulation n=1 Tax=Cavenderia fasciculata TaxID=261658 RepID=F4PKA4_CACFS|nr:Transcriptional repressor of sporulation [Cavenderia fasciculata]EGG24028.1 Transcriptional repressor of sporulation [Cavenderia fasciculata]|eukprot:XP_004361879.1 Transcriptional repressor of sporulation [Cavenderia fasciculata]
MDCINSNNHNDFKLELKRVTINDVEQLLSIGRRTFFESFSAVNTEDDMKQYLETAFTIDKLTAEVNDTNSEFYFAVVDYAVVVGYLKLNYGQSQTEIKDNGALEIERIYVLKEYHGKSVGQVLCNKALQVAKERASDYIWLGVWERNPRAISFYTKNGFVAFDKHIFTLGSDDQTDILMKLQLNK